MPWVRYHYGVVPLAVFPWWTTKKDPIVYKYKLSSLCVFEIKLLFWSWKFVDTKCIYLGFSGGTLSKTDLSFVWTRNLCFCFAIPGSSVCSSLWFQNTRRNMLIGLYRNTLGNRFVTPQHKMLKSWPLCLTSVIFLIFSVWNYPTIFQKWTAFVFSHGIL